MKKITVPILTEEYKVIVFIGTGDELIKAGARYLEIPEKEMYERLKNKRGIAYDTFSSGIKKQPAIFINGDYPVEESIATLAHEASHAMDYIQVFLGIRDINGEVHAHGIASVMRHSLKSIKKIDTALKI